MYGSIVDTFFVPLAYFVRNWHIEKIQVESLGKEESTTHQSFFDVLLKNPRSVLGNVSFWMVSIFEDFALLSIYGLISPLCAIALGTGLVAKIIVLRVSIVRYYRFQGPANDDGDADIDTICAVALKHTSAFVFPSFFASALFVAFYLWDMALDSDDSYEYFNWVLVAIVFSSMYLLWFSSKYQYHSKLFLRDSFQRFDPEALDHRHSTVQMSGSAAKPNLEERTCADQTTAGAVSFNNPLQQAARN